MTYVTSVYKETDFSHHGTEYTARKERVPSHIFQAL